MACDKHPIRSRKACPNCQEKLERVVLSPAKEGSIPKEVAEAAVKTVIAKRNTAALIEMEKEEQEMVIKAPRKQREAKPKEEIVAIVPSTNFETKVQQDQCKELFEKMIKNELVRIEEFFKKKLSDFQSRISDLATIRYEHLAIPETRFSLDLMNKLGNDGWSFRDSLRGEAAKVSGNKEAVCVFVRIKSDKYKKTKEEWEKK